MSETWIIFVPESPTFSPEIDCEDNAVAFIQEAFSPTEINVERTDHIEFYYLLPVEPHFRCPHCKTLSGVDFLDGIYIKGAGVPARFAANCCGNTVKLKDVCVSSEGDYKIPDTALEYGGFARFSISCLYPDKPAQNAHLERLSEYLGCKMRAIYKRF